MDASSALPPGYEHLTPEMCISCKGGKALCGKPCLWLAQVDRKLPAMRLTSQDIFGSSPPSVFVGRYGYPNVSFGPMLPPLELSDAKARELDTPTMWLDRRIEDVLGLRSALLRTRRAIRVRDASRPPPMLEVTQELALSNRPVDTEVHLAKKPNLEMTARLGDITAPMGPSVEPDRVRLAGNPRVPRAVDKIHSDEHVRASTAIAELYNADIPMYHIEKLLSVGTLGVRDDRKLVPTRWSITATDDQIGRHLIEGVKDFPELDGVHYHESVVQGNRFHVLLLPRPWSYDMIEVWLKGAAWTLETTRFIEDHEPYEGRTKYASNITGAYYAARLSILEHLHRVRRQAAPFVYREITPDYWAPLGVWVIREGVKRAMSTTPTVLPDLRSGLEWMRGKTLRQGWDRASWLIKDTLRQRRITQYASKAAPT